MPSSGTFARIGLIGAVAVVVGISTFGALLKQVTPRAITIGPAPVAATPAPPSPSDHVQSPATESASASAPARPAPAVVSSPTNVATANPSRPAGESMPAKSQQEPPPAAAPPSASSPSAFPPMQILTDVGPTGTSQPAQANAVTVGQPTAEKPAARRAADNRANKRKRKTRPAPYEMREFLAGRW
jgi:hypothetical protein